MDMAVLYGLPENWIKYDRAAIADELTNAKAALLSLSAIPYQRSWAEKLQEMELKREVAGTSKIEGAEFTDKELEQAISGKADEKDMTRSQKQARAAINTYRWISSLPSDRMIDDALVKEIHRRIVTGCDDDHCAPGLLRSGGQNVTFGRPLHRGVEGGQECEQALRRLLGALNQEFVSHDSLIQALALHYHFGAMHPFLDGNGRTARALEALMLQRAQMKDTLFIAMSNYYYDEKAAYLKALSDVRERNFDLTPFLRFGLIGIASQTKRLLREIRTHVEKSLFRDVMGRMYGRLRSTRKRALADRQIEILSTLLDLDNPIEYRDLYKILAEHYSGLREPVRAFVRDLNGLSAINAILVLMEGERETARFMVSVRPQWATEITETDFYREINKLPQAKTKLIISH
jgi:Fic family protein